jgi:hypothetical protein
MAVRSSWALSPPQPRAARRADERYTYFPEGLEPVWGMQLEQTARPLFRITPRYSYFGKLLRDLFRPRGYSTLASLPSNASVTPQNVSPSRGK